MWLGIFKGGGGIISLNYARITAVSVKVIAMWNLSMLIRIARSEFVSFHRPIADGR